MTDSNTIPVAEVAYEDYGDLSPNAFDPYIPTPKPCSLCGDSGKVRVEIALPDDDRRVRDWKRYAEYEFRERPKEVVVYECWRCHPGGLPRIVKVIKR